MEDFVNYYLPSMFLISSYCDQKCCTEGGFPKTICQNSGLVGTDAVDYSFSDIYNAYISNDISKAIVIGGLEPFQQFQEVYGLIHYFRENGCKDKFIIFTGYTEEEVKNNTARLALLGNIAVKFGRFIPGQYPHYDKVLGINLASDNQYGKELNENNI